MSIARACYVRCDECGVPAQISTRDARDARGIARGEGYVRRKGRDLCPFCAGRHGYWMADGTWFDYTAEEAERRRAPDASS